MADKFKNITDDELIAEVRYRDLEDNFQKYDDDDDDDDDDENLEEYHVLKKDFDRFQLRDHLCDITRLGSYVSDEKLFNTLGDLLEFS